MQLSTIVNNSTTLTMSSREIAELTGKRHPDVKRDIRVLFSDVKLSENEIVTSDYKDVSGRTQKEYILSSKLHDLLLSKYKGLARVPMRLQEEAALKTIEQLLGVTLIRQHKVLKYRIDGYDPESNTAYEIDEPQHNSKTHQIKDQKRQQEIEAVLGCKFVRIKL